MLGAELARRGHCCINGAGAHGVMGALNESCKRSGGRVRGVCHEMFVDGEITALFEGMELVQVSGAGLVERKAGLVKGADCFLALPGGPGTWDELWEVACARQLGIGRVGPTVLVNVQGYYEGFVLQLHRAHADGLLHKPPDEFLKVVDDPITALDYCEAHAGEAVSRAAVVVGGAERGVGPGTTPAPD